MSFVYIVATREFVLGHLAREYHERLGRKQGGEVPTALRPGDLAQGAMG